MKTCTKCGRTLPLEDFYKRKNGRDGRHAHCKSCWRGTTPEQKAAWQQAHYKDYYEKNREEIRARKRARYQSGQQRYKRFGITQEEFDARFTGKCEGCGRSITKNESRIDHDHTRTDLHMRGILCHGCNVSAGMMDDDPAKLRSLADYLEVRSGIRPPLRVCG